MLIDSTTQLKLRLWRSRPTTLTLLTLGKWLFYRFLTLALLFDIVHHDILLRRLNYSYGIGGTAWSWIRSFLSSRLQVINFAGQQSTRSTLTCGIPQGFALGPLLFSLYSANIISIAQSFDVRVHCYANDLQLYVHYRAGDTTAAIERLLLCIKAIRVWMGSNRLKLNLNKTQIIWLGSRQLATGSSWLISTLLLFICWTAVIIPTLSVCNLGVTFDHIITMSENVNNTIRTCFYQIRQLRSVRHLLSDETTKMFINAFVSSRLDFCNSLLYGATAQVTRRLQSVFA